MQQNFTPQTSLEEFDLPVRVYYALRSCDIYTLQDLWDFWATKGPVELLKISHFGHRSLQALTERVPLPPRTSKLPISITPSTRIDTLTGILSKRVMNTLKNIKIETVKDLQGLMSKGNIEILGIGEKGLNEVNNLMHLIETNDSKSLSVSDKKNYIQQRIAVLKAEIARLEKETKELELQQTLLTNGDNQK